jgi:hypothetical protein
LNYLYHAFCRCFRSEILLPDLRRRRTGVPDWILRIGRGAPPPAYELVAEHGTAEELLRVWRTEVGIRFVYEPVGFFDINTSGCEITWFPSEAPIADHVGAAVLGPVLALALHAQGTACLHGSAVRIGRAGVAFIAPKHFGKSTLAAALVEAGAELISDDTLAVEFEPAPVLLPGVHSLKLWRDSFDQIVPQLPSDLGNGVKPILRGYPAMAKRNRPTPFAAAYLLRPVHGDRGLSLERELVSPRDAVLSLVANTKIGALLQPAESGLLLSTAHAIVRRVPVYALTIPRDWGQLPEVVRVLQEWHAGLPAAALALEGAE